MAWRKQGLIYAPSGDRWWARTHAAVPTADVIDDQRIRVYFAALDEQRFGRIGYVEVDADNPGRILAESAEPVLQVGEPGAFDDCGVNPTCIVNVQGKKYLYYIGWQRCERVPYTLFMGLAVSDDNGVTFHKHSRVPILERTDQEPFLRTALCVIKERESWKGWYASCTHWSLGPAGIHYNLVIRHASSSNGIAWSTHEHPCIEPDNSEEYAVGRPWVIREDNIYKMWYSVRSSDKLYRIGYAESADGIRWTRKDAEVGITVADSGWDSVMICYPCVVDARGKRYLFYNGNRHGSTGFGYATWEPESMMPS